MALVEFEHVEKYYGDYHALRDINLRFEKGQVVVLLYLLVLANPLLSAPSMVWRLLTREAF